MSRIRIRPVIVSLLMAATPSAALAQSWTQRQPAVRPSARDFHGMAYDSARGEVVLFGGNVTGTISNETWIWNGGTWTQRFPLRSPSPRYAVTMAYDAARGEVVLFGGISASITLLDETWIWDGTTWTQRFPATVPPYISGQSIAYDAARQEVMYFSGSETWVWNGTAWTKRSPAVRPSPRNNQAMTYDPLRRRVVVFGGFDLSRGAPLYQPLGDTWEWDGLAWSQRLAAGGPSPRYNSYMAYDPSLAAEVVFGGYIQNVLPFQIYNDTWIWDGSAWRQGAGGPSARRGHSMVTDDRCGEIVLFGGGGASTPLVNDTWVWSSGAPGVPGGLTAQVSGSSVTLRWSPPPCGGTPSSYVIEAGSASGLVNVANFSTGSTATAFSASGIAPGDYFVRVRARNNVGVSLASNEAAISIAPPCTTAPGVPAGLRLVSVSGGTVALAWNASSGNPETHIVEAGSGPGLVNLATVDLGNAATTLTTSGVSRGTYYVRVRARNACGTSGVSNEVVVIVN